MCPIRFYSKYVKISLAENEINIILVYNFKVAKQNHIKQFIVYRLKVLAELGKIVLAGDWEKGWKDIVVQMSGGSSVVVED